MFVARLITTLIGVPVILALVALGSWPFALVVATVAALAAREACQAIGHRDASDPGLLALSMIGAFVLTAAAAVDQPAIIACFSVLLLAFASLPLVNAKFVAWPLALAATLYVALPLALLVALRSDGLGSKHLHLWGTDLTDGTVRVLLVLTSVWAVDVVAYVVGRLLGRRPFWPRISPKKTWEGTIAGVLAGVLVWLAWAPVLGLPLAVASALGLLAAIAAVVGDLTESAIKRSAGLKDTSALIPGHGGLLDRLDSLGFVAVVVFVCGLAVHL